MDETLRIIQHLYDRDDGVPDMDDDALQREYEELQAVKDVLDKREPVSPDPDVVDRIVAAASEAVEDSPARDARREERPARSHATSSWRRVLRRTSAALAVVLLLAVGWWQFGDMSSSSVPSTASAPPTAAESESEFGQQALDATAQEAEPAPRLDRPVRSASDLPDWDEGDDVVRLHRRIEILNARSTSSGWGDGALLRTTGQQRP